MSHTMMLLKLMSDGKNYTALQMSAALGLTADEVQMAMSCLRKYKAARAVDQPYQVTPRGVQWMQDRLRKEASEQARADRLSAEALARKLARESAKKRPGRPRLHDAESERRRAELAKREQARKDSIAAANSAEEAALKPVQRIVAAELSRDAIVASAVASRPALQAFWGQSV